MDTTEQYVKMNEKAVEIQVHNYADGDFVAYIRGRDGWVWASNGEPQVEVYYDFHRFNTDKIEYCWLPRQDQLQEMLPFGPPSQVHMMEDFMDSNYSSEIVGGVTEYKTAEQVFETWDQLWLAFVMKEKYNKVWNGEDWIKEE